MKIDRVDHFVLTVASIEAACAFYSDILGMDIVEFAGGRKALTFGDQKINLHEKGREFEPKSAHPMPGSADFCLIAAGGLEAVVAHLTSKGITIEEGPVPRTGASGAIRSVYIRDPDNNLVEIAEYV
ncbi:MAG: VOC family protein [Arenibacterium sp.]